MKSHYLQAMGVVRWRLREPVAAPTSQLYCLNGWIFEVSAHQLQQEYDLLMAISQALDEKAEEISASGDVATIHYSLAEILKNPLLKAKLWNDISISG